MSSSPPLPQHALPSLIAQYTTLYHEVKTFERAVIENIAKKWEMTSSKKAEDQSYKAFRDSCRAMWRSQDKLEEVQRGIIRYMATAAIGEALPAELEDLVMKFVLCKEAPKQEVVDDDSCELVSSDDESDDEDGGVDGF